MSNLPPQTSPPNNPWQRKHSPKHPSTRGYRDFRNCLRLDFAFTCPFCLLHEADFSRIGLSEGTGQTGIEHFVPRSHDETQAEIYENCFYCCRYCNGARSNKPIVSETGARLLDPTKAIWSDYFVVSGDSLSPTTNPDAAYTEQSYDLNDQRRVKLREKRRQLITEHVELLRDGPDRVSRLRKIAHQVTQDATIVVDSIEKIEELMVKAQRELDTYSSVPADAPEKCRCESLPLFTDPYGEGTLFRSEG
jgi:5-methylcytosine-specific restriction endonuclease McrA